MTNPMLDAALDYATRGWAVVPILPGEKRPAIDRWTERATTDPDLIAAWWRTHPTHGVGIATGPISGFFVLDVDGPQGADTLRRLEQQHGELPHTYTVATGSGGAHYYFTCPNGLEIRNDASKRLGPKLDIRGDGGQVVAPPTVHPNGTAYRWTHGDDPVPAPAWLLDLLQPVAAEPDRTPTPAPDRDDDTPWARFNRETTWEQILTADGWTLHHTDRTGEQHWTRPGKDKREGTSATIGYQGEDVLHVFTSSVTGLTPEGNYNRFGYIAATRYSGDVRAAARALRAEHDTRALNEWLARTTEAITEQTPVPTITEVADQIETASLVDTIRAKFLTGDAIEQLPPVEWLVDGVLERRSVANLYGPSGLGKSFIALDLAASIVTGRTWHGHPTNGGTVLYIAAEGAAGQGPRRRAWMAHYSTTELDGLVWYPEAINLTSPLEVAAFTEAATSITPALVIFDTQARCAVGAEENSAKDMGLIVAACDQIVAALECTVLLIHHTGKDASAGLRGSTAVLGAMNTVLALTRAGEHLSLTVEKQKNAEDGARHAFQLVPSADSVVAIEVARQINGLPDEMVELLRAVNDLDMGNGASKSGLITATGLSERTLTRRLKEALTANYCQKDGRTVNTRFSLTEQGETALAWGVTATPATATGQSSKDSGHYGHPLEGGHVAGMAARKDLE